MLHILTLSVLLCSFSVVHPFCPSLCTCIFHGRSDGTGMRTVLCNNPDMSEIPPGIPTDTVKLRVEKTAVRRMPARGFSNLPGLLYLWVSYSVVATIDSDALVGLAVLQELRLDGNLLTAFPWEALRATPLLRALGLRNNRLASVSTEAAKFLHNITYLDLSSNKLTTLPSDLMDIWPPFSTVIRDPSQKMLLGLQDNPWFCDCRISKLLELARMTNSWLVLMDPYMACSGPENLAGVPFQLVVLDQCLKPSVVISRARIVSLLGSNVLLRCDATGYPTPTLSWTRADGLPINTTVVQESPSYGIRWSIISLNAVLYKDAGEYCCKAKNVVGRSEASITLTVAGVITTTTPKAIPESTNDTWGGSISVLGPKDMAAKPTFTMSPSPSGMITLNPGSKEKVLSDGEELEKIRGTAVFRKPSLNGKNRKTVNTTFTAGQNFVIKNIQIVEETANSVKLLWSTDGVQDDTPLTVVYSSYVDKAKQTVNTEAGKGKLLLVGLKPQMKYMVCLIAKTQPQKNQCINFSTRDAVKDSRLGWMFAVAGAVICAMALPLSAVLLRKFLASSRGTNENDRYKDTYINFETLSLKQKTLGSQMGDLRTQQPTQGFEMMLLCSRSSTDSTTNLF